MRNIDNDIKSGSLKKVYLLYGEETYLVRQYRNKLVRALADPEDTMNFSSFSGKEINPATVIDLAETLPFFAERRLILIEDSGWAKKTPEEFGDYLAAAPDTTYFLFVEKEVDKRSRLMKDLARMGYAAEIGKQNEQLLARWVGGRIRKEGKQMTQKAFEQLILRTGNDMEVIDRELEKLLCYAMDREVIDVAEVEAIVTDHSERRIFDLVDALAFRQTRRAMDLYYDLVAQHEPPLLILHLITKQYQNLMITKAMTNKSSSSRDIASALGVQDWLVRKYQSQSRAYDTDRLKKAVSDGVAYEEAVKTGKLQDSLAVEMFISEYSR